MSQNRAERKILILLLEWILTFFRWRTHASLPVKLLSESFLFPKHLHDGRAQISLSFIAGMSNLLGGLEVAYEHYRGSYGQRIMYSPVILSSLACGACLWAVVNKCVARTLMPAISSMLLIDGILGFFFHILAALPFSQSGRCRLRFQNR